MLTFRLRGWLLTDRALISQISIVQYPRQSVSSCIGPVKIVAQGRTAFQGAHLTPPVPFIGKTFDLILGGAFVLQAGG